MPWEVVELLHQALIDDRVVARFDQGGRIDLSADGELLAIAGQDGNVTLRDAATGAVLQTLEQPTGAAGPFDEDATLSPEGTRVAHGTRDGSLRVTNVATGEVEYEQALIEPDAPPRSGEAIPPNTSLAFSPDGSQLAFASALSDTVAVVDTSSWEVHAELSHLWPADLAFGPDGRRLAVAGLDGVVRVWSLPDEQLQETITLPDDSTPTATVCTPQIERARRSSGTSRPPASRRSRRSRGRTHAWGFCRSAPTGCCWRSLPSPTDR